MELIGGTTPAWRMYTGPYISSVKEFLNVLGLSEYAENFSKDFALEEIKYINKEELELMGMKKFEVLRVLRHGKRMKAIYLDKLTVNGGGSRRKRKKSKKRRKSKKRKSKKRKSRRRQSKLK